MSKIIITLVFLTIWFPAFLVSYGNMSVEPPLLGSAPLQGPYYWKYDRGDFVLDHGKPRFYLYGQVSTKKRPLELRLNVGAMEWLLATSKRSHTTKRIYRVESNERPFVSEWEFEHDRGLNFSIGSFRFNGLFIFTAFFCLVLPALFVLLMVSDDFEIDSPEKRRQKSQRFVELVKAVESRAAAEPGWLKRKTIQLALLGYLVVLGSIFLMIPVGIGLFGSILMLGGLIGIPAVLIKFAIILAFVPLGFAWHMGKSLLLPGYGYQGIEIKAKQCPQLFEFLRNICKQTKGPKFKRVFIDQNLNAMVSRSGGVLGFFGMGPVVLTLGLPLLQIMSLKQLEGVIGHEYGHVAAKDNALSQWIYRIRNSWLELGERLQTDALWYVLKLNRFYDWFIAGFSAHSFALSRQCEYEADAFSVRLAGKEGMAESLAALAVFGKQFDETFWETVWKRSDNGETIEQVRPYNDLPGFFTAFRDPNETATELLQQKTGYSSTHPCINDRLQAIGTTFHAPALPDKSAAALLLGSMESNLIDEFNNDWQNAAGENWQARYEQYRSWLESLERLTGQPLEELSDEDLNTLISVTVDLKEDERFCAANLEMLRRHPDNQSSRLNCIWYRLLVEKDPEQLAILEQFGEENPQFLPNCCRYAIDFLYQSGRGEEAEKYMEQLENWQLLRDAAADERSFVTVSDQFEEHDLPESFVSDFIGYCREHPIIGYVFLVKKSLKYMPEYPCYIIAYKTKPGFWMSQKTVKEKVENFIYHFGYADDFRFHEADSINGLEKKLRKINGALVYRK